MHGGPLALPLAPSGAARKQYDEHAKEEQHESRDERPHARSVIRARSLAVLVDIVDDDPERHEIHRHDDERDDPRDERDQRADQRANHPGAERDQESQEGDAAGDGVQDHDVCQTVGGVGGCLTEAGAFGVGHFAGRTVADGAAGAEVAAIRLATTKNTVTEGAKGDGGTVLAEIDAHDRDGVDHGGGDGGYEEADGGGEEEEGAEPGGRSQIV